jgi:hypothetical protein
MENRAKLLSRRVKKMEGTKHLIQCHCVLPTLRKLPNPLFHSFVVFSVLDENGNVVVKDASCNNCGIVHKVVDICKSEISSKENSSAIITEEDISLMLPSQLTNILKSYQCDIATWEHVHFIYSEQKWGTQIVLKRDVEKDSIKGKSMTIEGPNKFKIETFNLAETF